MTCLSNLNQNSCVLTKEQMQSITGGRRIETFNKYGQAKKKFNQLKQQGEIPNLMEGNNTYCIEW